MKYTYNLYSQLKQATNSKVFTSVKSGNKILRSFLVVPVLLSVLSIFTISNFLKDGQNKEPKQASADNNETLEQIGEREKKIAFQKKFFENYGPNEMLIKLKPGSGRLKLKPGGGPSQESEITEKAFGLLEESSIPQSLKALNRKHSIKSVDKVFKNAETPQAELAKIKSDNNSGISNIDEENFLVNDLSGIYSIKFNSSLKINDIISDFSPDSSIETFGPNRLALVNFTPNDPLYNRQWSITKTFTNLAWDTQRGSSSTIIGILDTGVDVRHEDLVNSLKVPCANGCATGGGWDTVNIDTADYQSHGFTLIPSEDYTLADNLPADYFGHGTHVAGIVAATGNNSKGISGVCPNCKVLPVRVGFGIKDYNGNEIGTMEYDDIAAGIRYAANNGAKIISMSFGGPADNVVLKPAIDYAKSLGVLLIASAGNSYTDSNQYSYPAAYPGVIAVTATDLNDDKTAFSNYGYWTSVAAPGWDIFSTVPRTGPLGDPSGYGRLSGTSMSAPFVAGVAGLILSKNPTWVAEKVRRTLLMSTDLPHQAGQYLGYGRINSQKSVLLSSMTLAQASITSPQNDTLTSSNQTITGSALGQSYKLEYGTGIYPGSWTQFSSGASVNGGSLGIFPVLSLPSQQHTVKLSVRDTQGTFYERRTIGVDKDLKSGWPINMISSTANQPAIADVNGDNKKEIITAFSYFPPTIKVFDFTGKILRQWSAGDSTSATGPAIGDLDNDGISEIVVTNVDRSLGGMLFVYNYHQGLVFQKMLQQGDQLTCPVLADVNGDSFLDIITVSLLGKVFVLDRNGNNLPGWPQTTPKFDIHGFDCPAVADINNDGRKEIIVPRVIDGGFNQGDLWRRFNGGITVYNSDGSVLWAKTYNNDFSSAYWSRAIHASPVVGDINNDGKMEIVLAQDIFNANDFNDRVYKNRYIVLDNNGNLVQGWPKDVDSLGDLTESAVLADLNGDSKLEILGKSKNSLTVWQHDGSLLFNPVVLDSDNFGEAEIGIPSVGDINGDSKPEILISNVKNCRYSGCDRRYKLFAISNTGQIMSSNWPKELYGNSTWAVPILTDLENDSKTDVVFETSGKIFVWNLNTPRIITPNSWEMWQNNVNHSGLLRITGKNYCDIHSDCACGVDRTSNQCSIENKAFLVTGRCSTPNFCTGVSGTCTPGCINNSCRLVCPTQVLTPTVAPPITPVVTTNPTSWPVNPR